MIHYDVWGPSPVATKERFKCYVFSIDDRTRYCWVYLMKCWYDFIHVNTTFCLFVKTQHSVVIKCFRCDLGKEYTSIAFSKLLIFDGVVHYSSCINTS